MRADTLETIELRYRLADEVIPVLEPLLDPGGAITGMDGVVLVRTNPANLEQIRRAIVELDRKPRQLLVTVGQGTVAADTLTSATGRATLGGGDVRVGINGPPSDGTGAEISVRDRRQRVDLHDLSSVRTLEGSETYIAIGQSLPVTTTQVIPGRNGPLVSKGNSYREVDSGFYATPRVAGDRVTLSISSRQQHLTGAARDGVVQSAGATSVVSGRLGEWIPLGATASADSGGSSGLLLWGVYTSSSEYAAWVKVDEIP
jgi:type II secretory pathway component GspD/PulD (secretin)